MTLERIIDICKAYNDLGSAVAEQVDDAIDSRPGDANPNALEHYIIPFLKKVREHADGNGDDELLEEVTNVLSDIKDYLREE